MLKKRIIPILQYEYQHAIKTKKFQKNRNLGNLLQYVKVFNRRKSDELSVLNLTSKFEKKQPSSYNLNYLKSIVSECNMPLSVGGSINKIDEIENLLAVGCDKIIVGKSFLENKKFIIEIEKNFGSQIIIASIDINFFDGKYFLNYDKSKDFLDHLKIIQDHGVGEIIINAVHKDGTMSGYDFRLLEKVYDYLTVPVLFNGGAKNKDDFLKILSFDKVQGACASSIFLFTEETPDSIKRVLSKKIKIRI